MQLTSNRIVEKSYAKEFVRQRPALVITDPTTGAELLRTPTNMPGQYSYTFMAQSTHTTISFEEIVATNSTILLSNFTLQEVGGRYVYGYNTQEKVDEVSGSGNHYTAEFWEYDTRVVTRWNVDPVTFPWQSPYVINNNNPIYYYDPNGLWGKKGRAERKQIEAKKKLGDDRVGEVFNRNEGTDKKPDWGFHIFSENKDKHTRSDDSKGSDEIVLRAYKPEASIFSSKEYKNAQGGGGGNSNNTGFGGFNQGNVDFAGSVGGGLTTVFGAASHYSGFIKAAGKIGGIGNAVTGLTYGHAVLTHQAKPAHHLDAAVTGALIVGGLVSIVVPPVAPYVIGIGFGYGGGRLVGGEAFDNWFNSQFTPTPVLSPNKIKQ
jgi:hypothetical protein